MEKEILNETAENNNVVEEAGNKVDTQTTEKTEGKAEVKMITLEEAQKMVDKALAKKLPPKEEMEEFRKWKESQKTEAEKQAEIVKKLEATESQLSALHQENLALKKGVKVDDLDYVVFKVSRLEGDFEENLEKFLKENPKFTSKNEVATSKNDGTATQKIVKTPEDGVMAILKQKHPDLYE